MDDEQGPLLGFGHMGTHVFGQSQQKLVAEVGEGRGAYKERFLRNDSGCVHFGDLRLSGYCGVVQINLLAEQLRNLL